MSPRIALVVGDEARAALFAEHLHAALEARSAVIPRGTVPTGDLADITAYVSTMAFAGSALVGTSHAVGIARRSTPLVLPPSYRTVHVACIASVAEAAQTLTPVSRGVVVVGADDLDAARTFTPSGARLTKLGCMQKPPLDGPVDLRRQVSRS